MKNDIISDGYATSRKEVVAMHNFVKKALRITILVIIALVAFAIEAK